MKLVSIFSLASLFAAGINAMPTANDALKARSAILERAPEKDVYHSTVKKRESDIYHSTVKREAAPESDIYHSTVKKRESDIYHNTKKRRESMVAM